MKNRKMIDSTSYMKSGKTYNFSDLTNNGRTIELNIENGLKSYETKKQKLIEKAEIKGISVLDLVNEYMFLKNIESNDFSNEGILAKELSYTTKESFSRWGDKNYIDRMIISNWIRKDGNPLDTMIDEINDMYNSSITIDKAIDFILKHPAGRKEYKANVAIAEFEKTFFELVGFKIDFQFARKFRTKATSPDGCVWEFCEALGMNEEMIVCPF